MYKTLEMIREKKRKIENLNDQIARISVMYKSPRFDGMPKGEMGDAMTARMEAKEEIEGIRDALKLEIEEMESKAKIETAKLPEQLRAFCVHYFYSACSEEETCRIIDRDRTTLYRYKREIKKMLGE